MSEMSMSFKEQLEPYFAEFLEILSTPNEEWSVKGFIDVKKNIYTVSVDTKVISKIIELMIFPIICRFAEENKYEYLLCKHQNHYPDITFISKETREKIALDLKSTYKVNDTTVNGMTLGAFTGYFRERDSTKNILFPYSQYSKHYILGVMYSRTINLRAEKAIQDLGYSLTNKQKQDLDECFGEEDETKIAQFISSFKISSPKTKARTLKQKILDYNSAVNNNQRDIILPKNRIKITPIENFFTKEIDIKTLCKELTIRDIHIEKICSFINDVNSESLSKENELKNKVEKIIADECIDEKKPYKLEELESITSVACHFEFFIQEKWKIAIDTPGSGNTKNIGSSKKIEELRNGTSIFTAFGNDGKRYFDEYWKHYMTKDMATQAGYGPPPYQNLETFLEFRGFTK